LRIIRRSIGAVGLCCLLLGACAETAGDGPETYVVRPQDTLYSVAWRHDLDFRDLARWNNVGADFHISVGQVLVLAPPASAANPRGASREVQTVPARWVWPTDPIGAPRPVPGGGILVPGRLGQDVRAASAGRVVYTGSGLRGYGNLIIIKHADSLLSAYAHNREMLVHDGQEGEGTHQSAILYFEIRQNGKPIDPLPFFSK
jgi:lipoprotein NlpD